MRRLEHPAVERDAVSAIDLEKFGRRFEKHGGIRTERGVVFQDARGTMGGEFDQVSNRRDVGARILVEGPVGIRGHIVIMRAG